MSLLGQALRAGAGHGDNRHREPAATRHLLIAGAAGPLGSAVLERALADSSWALVSALVTRPLEVAMRGLRAVQVPPALDAPPERAGRPETAVIVFDRERSRHGREAAFLRPDPPMLAPLARWLRAAGVQQLVLVLPHAPALLPQALRAGLASLDEHAVAALGFEHLVIVRPSRVDAPDADASPSLLQRLASAMLSQLHWMVPQRDQPLRREKVAEFVIQLARLLAAAPPASRVAPPELLWDWAQPEGGTALLQAWLRDGRLAPAAHLPRPRV